MLGYSFDVYRQKIDNKVPVGRGDKIVRWIATPSGLNWLDELVEEGNATCVMRGYYPSLYNLQFKELLPIIESKKPPFVMRDMFYTYLEDFLSCCDTNETMIIEVWDQS